MSIKSLFAIGICFCLSLNVSANPNEPLEILQAQKKEAMKYYQDRNYESAYQIFSKLYLSALSDRNINFFLGRSAFETGRYEIALAAFERVEVLDPKNVRNQLEIAKTQYFLKMYEDARLGFKRVLSNPALPDSVRTNVELFAAKIDNKLRKSFFFGTVKLGGVYDSNVNYGGYEESYNLPDYGKFSTIEEESDFAYDAEADLVHIYDIGQKNGYSIRNSLMLYNREYDTMEEYDISYFSYNPALVYQDLKNTYELNLMLDHMQLHHESYLNNYSIMPSLIHKADARTNLLAYLKYSDKNFLRSVDDERDADNLELSLAVQKLWSSAYLTLKVTGDRDRKHRGERVDVDYYRQRFNVDYANQFSQSYSLKVQGEVNRRAYKDYSNLFKNTRLDKGYKAGLTLTKKMTSTFYVEAKALYERTWSNQGVYAYHKSTYGLTLNKSF